MATIIVISVLALVVISTLIYLQKKGKIEDKDGNLIPDVVEEKAEQVKEVVKEVNKRAKRVVEETKDVAVAAKEVIKQSKDVVNAAKGNNSRKGRKPASKKSSN